MTFKLHLTYGAQCAVQKKSNDMTDIFNRYITKSLKVHLRPEKNDIKCDLI